LYAVVTIEPPHSSQGTRRHDNSYHGPAAFPYASCKLCKTAAAWSGCPESKRMLWFRIEPLHLYVLGRDSGLSTFGCRCNQILSGVGPSCTGPVTPGKVALRVLPTRCTQCTRACAFSCAHEPQCICGAASHHITPFLSPGAMFCSMA
jgi:hypothetical protein